MWWYREVEGNKVEGFLSLALNQKIEKPDLHFANRVFCFRAIVIAVGGTTKQSYCGRYTRSKIALPKIQKVYRLKNLLVMTTIYLLIALNS
jgi:hypothetical protein